MFSNNFISKVAYIFGWILALAGFLGLVLGLPAILLGIMTDENDAWALGWMGVNVGVLFFVVGLIMLLLQQILEYLIVVEDHLKAWRRKEEKKTWEERIGEREM